MAMLGKKARQLCAVLIVSILGIWCASCSHGTEPARQAFGDTTVGIFTPRDPINIGNRHSPNSWDALYSDIRQELMQQGFSESAISHTSSSGIEDQSRELSSYVKAQNGSHKKKIIFIAPAQAESPLTKDYSPYAAQQDGTTGTAVLRGTLDKARSAGIRTILFGNTVKGFTADIRVPMLTGRDVGRVQAKQLVSKLKLSEASAKHPASIEILLPPVKDNDFTKETFRGIWDILGPYYASESVYSPSGLLTKNSSAKDWKNVTADSSDHSSTADAVTARLATHNGHRHRRINGILAVNDNTAAGVIKALGRMGYTGSSADINPQISVGGVVRNLTGGATVKRRPVPEPLVRDDRADSPADGSRNAQETADYPQWPIVTGFGAYLSSLPDIVNGKQWSTTFIDRKAYARDLAQICAFIAQDKSIGYIASAMKNVSEDSAESSGTTKSATLDEPLLTISASNMKTILIDKGYIKATDADL